MASLNQNGDIPTVVDVELFDDPSYQRLSEIQTSLKYEGDYEDPTPLLDKHEQPTAIACPPPKRIHPAARTASGRPVPPARKPKNAKNDPQTRKGRDFPDDDLEARREEELYETIDHLQDEKGPLIQPTEDSDEDLESDSSGEVPVRPKRPAQIRQSWVGTVQGENKLYVTGSLVHNRAPLSFKSHTLQENPSSGILEEQGIYQGLVMTNSEKQRLGIMPESIYMTANLEQWAYELEHMTLKMAAHEPPSPASTFPSQAGAKPIPGV